MILLSDGRQYVYAVFIGDGHECVDLYALYDDAPAAEADAQRLRESRDWCGCPESLYGSHAFVEVETREILRRSLSDEEAAATA